MSATLYYDPPFAREIKWRNPVKKSLPQRSSRAEGKSKLTKSVFKSSSQRASILTIVKSNTSVSESEAMSGLRKVADVAKVMTGKSEKRTDKRSPEKSGEAKENARSQSVKPGEKTKENKETAVAKKVRSKSSSNERISKEDENALLGLNDINLAAGEGMDQDPASPANSNILNSDQEYESEAFHQAREEKKDESDRSDESGDEEDEGKETDTTVVEQNNEETYASKTKGEEEPEAGPSGANQDDPQGGNSKKWPKKDKKGGKSSSKDRERGHRGGQSQSRKRRHQPTAAEFHSAERCLWTWPVGKNTVHDLNTHIRIQDEMTWIISSKVEQLFELDRDKEAQPEARNLRKANEFRRIASVAKWFFMKVKKRGKDTAEVDVLEGTLANEDPRDVGKSVAKLHSPEAVSIWNRIWRYLNTKSKQNPYLFFFFQRGHGASRESCRLFQALPHEVHQKLRPQVDLLRLDQGQDSGDVRKADGTRKRSRMGKTPPAYLPNERAANRRLPNHVGQRQGHKMGYCHNPWRGTLEQRCLPSPKQPQEQRWLRLSRRHSLLPPGRESPSSGERPDGGSSKEGLQAGGHRRGRIVPKTPARRVPKWQFWRDAREQKGQERVQGRRRKGNIESISSVARAGWDLRAG